MLLNFCQVFETVFEFKNISHENQMPFCWFRLIKKRSFHCETVETL